MANDSEPGLESLRCAAEGDTASLGEVFTETAQILEIGEAAASRRFVRALRRLKAILAGGAHHPGLANGGPQS